MKLNQCHNFQDFRLLAKKRLPSPIFNYIDGAADDEITYRRNTQSFNDIEPSIFSGVDYVVNLRQQEKSKNTPSSIILLKKNGEIKIIR